MKKIVLGIATLIVTAGLAFGAVNMVSAQGTTPPVPTADSSQTTPPGNGRGMMGGQNTRMGWNDQDGNNPGLLREYMTAALAEKLGMTQEELTAEFTAGKTLLDIAADKNLSVKEFITLKDDARQLAIENALKAGDLTQAQADWLKSNDFRHMGGRGQGGGRQGCPIAPQQ